MDADDKRRKGGTENDLKAALSAMQETQNAQTQLLLGLAQRLMGPEVQAPPVQAPPVPPASAPANQPRRRRARATGPQVAQTRKASPAEALAPEAPVAEPERPKPRSHTEELEQRIEDALMKESLDDTALSHVIKQKVALTRELLKGLREKGKVSDVGYEGYSIWTWRIGNDTDTQVLYSTVKRLITERPMPATALVAATGADPKRVDGVVVQLRRNEHVVDMGVSDRRRMYFIMPSEMKEIGLPKKPWKGRKK